jgi:hypothetical protein
MFSTRRAICGPAFNMPIDPIDPVGSRHRPTIFFYLYFIYLFVLKSIGLIGLIGLIG